MKTLLLRDGDLVLDGPTFKLATGATKVLQDLSIALREPLGSDRFHRRWGSLLDSHVGGIISQEAHFRIESEAARVVDNYITVQRDRIQQDISQGVPSRYGAGEVIREIIDITVRPEHDRIHLRINLRLMTGDELSVLTSMEI